MLVGVEGCAQSGGSGAYDDEIVKRFIACHICAFLRSLDVPGFRVSPLIRLKKRASQVFLLGLSPRVGYVSSVRRRWKRNRTNVPTYKNHKPIRLTFSAVLRYKAR